MQDTKKNEIKIRIGTRGSQLALAQAHEVRDRLCAAHDALTPDTIEIIVMSTRGDRILDRPLSEIGGKGLFTEEIEAALLGGQIDIAVHSLKDMPVSLPEGLELCCYLEREDARDAFISAKAHSLMELPAGSLIGSASLRRQAQTLALRPDVRVESFRGNVQSRLKKLDQDIVDATFLAMAGLNRLGLTDSRIHPMDITHFLPAVAQGAICIEIASHNEAARNYMRPLNHRDTEICVRAERAMLKILDGSCRTPIAGHATIKGGQITLEGRIYLPDGSESHAITASGQNPEELGTHVGSRIRDMAGAAFFKKLDAAL
ncbi:Porphobilinogen deaminase [hydrothermal vent metagenome]|uniref:hydroxymethylbilane synthase n=1 Tax=hydrothermal vent metagenome TaxID=652676 RepID=A0A3B0RMF4_9ZZZZ